MNFSKIKYFKLTQHKWRTFCALPPKQRLVLIQALYLFPLTGLSLKILGHVSTQRFIQKLPYFRFSQLGEISDPHTVARLSSSAANLLPFPPRCLLRSLVCSRLLDQESFPHQLRIGIRKNEGNLLAHAWIDIQNVPLSDSKALGFAAFN